MDLIERSAAIDAILRRADKAEKQVGTDHPFWEGLLIAKNIVDCLPSVQPDQNAYEQGRITGRVEMRTEMLSALKSIVGSEVWNNV